MFEVDAKCYTWSRTIHGRGKRAELVTTGCYIVEHISTGKCLISSSDKVSMDVDRVIASVSDGTHKNKKFVKLCAHDDDFKLYEFPAPSIRAAKQIEKAIRQSMQPTYLLMD